jgi:ubiquinol-cytochrome c reductase cytochrome b subunit
MLKNLGEWLAERWPIRPMLRWSLEEEIAGGSSFWYTLGACTLFTFVVQVVTGVWQLFYYVPAKDHAYDSVMYLRLQVPFGWLIHGLHYWGANAFVVLVALHAARVFVWGAYKKPRELTWLAGVALLLLVLSMTFTGALLAWDELGYWAAEVGTSIAGTVPLIGDFMERVLRGGATMEQLSLSRFFGLHVAILSGLLALFIGIHLLAFRQFRSAGPWNEEKRKRIGWFWPDQVFKDLAAVTVVLLALVALSAFVPAQISGPADPLDTTYTPKPEWNFLFLYQVLKLFKGPLEPVGTVGVPLVLALILLLLPFLDRREERNPARRVVAMAGGVVFAGFLIAFTVLGYYSHPGVSARPARPGAAPRSLPIPWPLSASAQKGEKLFLRLPCIKCHTINGVGGSVGPNLSGEAGRGRSRDWLRQQVRNAKSHFPRGPMPAFTMLTDRQVANLVDFLSSLRGAGGPAPGSEPSAAGPAGGEQAPPAAGAKGPGPAASMVGDPEHGGLLFAQECRRCHGPGGAGQVLNPGSADGTVPPLKGIDPELFSKDPARFAAHIDGFIQHGSKPEGPNPALLMPAFGDTGSLTQPEIAHLEAHLLALNGVNRAQIRNAGVAPPIFFLWSVGAFGAAWLGLGGWWVRLRRRRAGALPAEP